MKVNKIVKYLVDEYGWSGDRKFTDMQLELIKDVVSVVTEKSGAGSKSDSSIGLASRDGSRERDVKNAGRWYVEYDNSDCTSLQWWDVINAENDDIYYRCYSEPYAKKLCELMNRYG